MIKFEGRRTHRIAQIMTFSPPTKVNPYPLEWTLERGGGLDRGFLVPSSLQHAVLKKPKDTLHKPHYDRIARYLRGRDPTGEALLRHEYENYDSEEDYDDEGRQKQRVIEQFFAQDREAFHNCNDQQEANDREEPPLPRTSNHEYGDFVAWADYDNPQKQRSPSPKRNSNTSVSDICGPHFLGEAGEDLYLPRPAVRSLPKFREENLNVYNCGLSTKVRRRMSHESLASEGPTNPLLSKSRSSTDLVEFRGNKGKNSVHLQELHRPIYALRECMQQEEKSPARSEVITLFDRRRRDKMYHGLLAVHAVSPTRKSELKRAQSLPTVNMGPIFPVGYGKIKARGKD